jgi:dephospho-CoA kinase
MNRKLVIGITGMPGSGKSTAAEVAKTMGYPVIVMGNFVREEAKKRGLDPTPENLGKLMIQMRREKGKAIIAKLATTAVKNSKDPVIVIDGVRSLNEVAEFKRNFQNFKLLAVHAPQKTRFIRLYKRARSDDPHLWREFSKRDRLELKVGVGSAIAMADKILESEDSINELKRKTRKILELMANEHSS